MARGADPQVGPLPLRCRGDALAAAIAARVAQGAADAEPQFPARCVHGALLAAFLAAGRFDAFSTALAAALDAGVPTRWLGESILQSYLFAGFPRTWTALKLLRDARASKALPDDWAIEFQDWDAAVAGGTAIEPLVRGWWARGETLCREIYGDQYDRLRANLSSHHPELADWMILEGYGKVLARPEISPVERELWILPILTVQDAREQLHSHLRGALRVGASETALRAVLRLAGAAATRSAVRDALARLSRLAAAR